MNKNSVNWWNESERGKPYYSETKPVPVQICPTEIAYGFNWDRKQASAVRNRWKTARDMARPSETKIQLNFIQGFNSYRAVNAWCLGYKTESEK